MPPVRNRRNGPTRRSERLSEPSRKSNARKQKNSEAHEAEHKVKMLMMTSSDGRMIDSCCWICHKPAQDQNYVCTSCPRVYHNQCLKSTSSELSSLPGVCPECLVESVDGTKLASGITQKVLRETLLYMLLKLYHSNISHKVLKNWPLQSYQVSCPVDLSTLSDHVKNWHYNSTAAFYGDAKWMYHNCYNVFGANSDKTNNACKILKQIKNGLLYLESCYECCIKDGELENSFVKLCQNPHRLLWVKLKGYPYWPAKCLKVINGIAYVQFFGTHDRTTVKANTCFLMSKKNPSGKDIQRSAYQNSADEMNLYIKNYEEKYGPFQYAKEKTIFVPSDDECFVVKKRQEASCSLNVSLSSEVENENVNPDESIHNSSPEIEIIDDVEIAESDNTLFEDCHIIDVPDEDEPGNGITNSANGNVENQGVGTAFASHHDRVALFQEDFVSPRFVLQVPSPLLQNTSTVFEPSTSGINASNSHQEEIHPNLHSESIAEPLSDSYNTERNQHREEVEVCYLEERQRPKVIHLPRTDLSTLSHPLVKSGVSEGEENMEDIISYFKQHFAQSAHFPKLVQKLVVRAMELNAELQVKQEELRELEERLATAPDFRKITVSICENNKQLLTDRIALEKKKAQQKKSDLFELIHLNQKRHLALRNSKNEPKKFVNQETMTESQDKPFPLNTKYFEQKLEEMRRQVKQKFEEEVLHAKSNSWCKNCLSLATIHCCINANYCDAKCQKADLARHTAICKDPRKL